MRITIFGSGYVGLVTGACLAETGNQVMCVDIDARKIEALRAGQIPIHEPGLEPMVLANAAAGRLQFTTSAAEGVSHADVIFIAVGTPPDENGSADLRYVLAVAEAIGTHMMGFKVVVDKSTVPVGTADKVRETLDAALTARGIAGDIEGRLSRGEPGYTVISNPEFLKEGAAIADFMRPDRIILGAGADEPAARGLQLMQRIYAPFNHNHERVQVMDLRSAEFTKYAANAMLATRISFMNELANLAEVLRADIEAVRRGIGSDPRIGYSFLYAGAGYGGSCFPKDVRALQKTAEEHGRHLQVLAAVEAANEAQKSVLSAKVTARFGEDLKGRCFTVWGLAFKPETDDMREAPSRVVLDDLTRRGATIVAFDPVAMPEARRVLSTDLGDRMGQVRFADTAYSALEGADALIIMTEWKAFRVPDFVLMAKALKSPVVFDGRNMYEPDALAEAGIDYFPIGRRQGR